MATEQAISTIGDDLPAERDAAEATRARAAVRLAFRRADIAALRIGFFMRLVALGAIAVWLSFLIGFPTVSFFLAFLLVFIALGYAQLKAGASGRVYVLYALIFIDFFLLAFVTTTDNPLADYHFPPGQKLHQSRELYFFVLLAAASACYEPWRVVWSGFCAILAWNAAFFALTTHPDAITVFDTGLAPNLDAWMALTANPNFVDFNRLLETCVVLAIVTGILAMVAKRAQTIVRSQIEATRERGNLARHFAPNLVDQLAQTHTPFQAVKAQSAAILFADVVAFSRMAEDEPPERVIGFLRELHERFEQAIFDNGGTLDKFMGDGVMASFGTPTQGPDDACRALAAARDIQQAIADWGAQRNAAGFVPAKVAVGVHYGPVVSGDIGSERRMEFATIGDAVNVAARLEAAARPLEAGIVISAELAAQAEKEDATRAFSLIAGFKAVDELPIPGHSAIDAMALKRA